MAQLAGPASERIECLDALRGLALFGILTANILYWSGWLFMSDPQKLALASPQTIATEHFLHNLLIDGKFYTIFSLLFGAGFALQLERLQSRGANGLRIYRRRILVLLGFGLIHMILIWDGDILTLYALLGLALPLFRRWSDRALLMTAVALLLLPLIGVPLFATLGWAPHQYLYDFSDRLAHGYGVTDTKDGVAWLRGGWDSFFSWAISGWPYAIGIRLESWRIPKVLGIMLIGMIMGRRLAAGTLLSDRKLLWRVLATGLVIGVPFSFAYALGDGMGQQSIPAVIGTAPLGLAYAAAFVLAWPHASRVLGVLAAPGKMALTNYLSHSLLGIVIFYGIGFGLIGRLPPLGFYAVAVAIFACQIVFSRWWLANHPQGPMEALWRRLTYGPRPLHAGAEHANAG